LQALARNLHPCPGSGKRDLPSCGSGPATRETSGLPSGQGAGVPDPQTVRRRYPARPRPRRQFNAFFSDWDIALCPAAASAAWPHDQKGERWQRKITVNNKRVPTTDQLFWAGYSGVVYLPSTVGPAGITRSGLPVGYQAIAAGGRDRWATTFSRLVEREIGGFVPPPGYE
jgi:Asp-tRNA(Asn)/Glu-tRNA(Gln) amidotransferase A subunit family amidase